MSAPRFMREYVSDKERRLLLQVKDGKLTAEGFHEISCQITKVIRAYECGTIGVDDAMTELVKA